MPLLEALCLTLFFACPLVLLIRLAVSLSLSLSLSLSHTHTVRALPQIHPLWLRERCDSPKSVHGSTGQRLFEISDLCGVKCTGVELVGKTARKEASVDVTFSDGHVSSFSPDHLARSARNHKAWADSAGGWWLPEPKLWSSSEFAVTPFFNHDDVVERKSIMQALLGQLHSHGAVIVRGCPTTDGTIAEFGRRIGVIRDTNWGAVFEVREEDLLVYTLYTPFIHPHYHIYTYVHPLYMYIHHIYT